MYPSVCRWRHAWSVGRVYERFGKVARLPVCAGPMKARRLAGVGLKPAPRSPEYEDVIKENERSVTDATFSRFERLGSTRA